MVQGAGTGAGSARTGSRAGTAAFWCLGIALLVYVAACTGHRDNLWEADAWEHHRVLVELARDPAHPGNPTFAVDDPSIRYSPWSLALALIARGTGISTWTVLGAAAVANTLLLLVGVRRLLAAFGQERAAFTALVVMVCLYGGAPGYANSWALADLPWQQVNPSAFAFPLCLLLWAVVARLPRALASSGSDAQVRRRSVAWRWTVVTALLALALLTHPMTGFLGAIGLASLAATSAPGWRRSILLGSALSGCAAMLICTGWPWFDFLGALRSDVDRDYWFNGAILTRMLTQWCLPAFVGALCALPLLRRRDLVRFCAFSWVACLLLAAIAAALRSATLARLPLAGVIFPQLMVAVVLHEGGALDPRTWRERLARVLGRDLDAAARPLLEMILCVGIVCFVAPQLRAIVREPWLGRAIVAPMLQKEDKQLRLRARFDRLLCGVGPRDVVLSDPVTSWPAPSSAGRIVTALHREYFVRDQAQRARDVDDFLGDTSDAERFEVLRRWNVRWILLNRDRLGTARFDDLLVPAAVVAQDAELVLMDASLWEATRARERPAARPGS